MKRRKKVDEVVPESVPDSPPVIPESGFAPEDFPKVSVALIPYSAQTYMHPDPIISISRDGWLLIDTGMVRFALPSRAEWNKLTVMVETLWNTNELNQQKEENIHDGSAVDGQGQSQSPVPSNGQQ